PILGKYDKAIEEAKKAIALDPQFPFAYVNLATAYQLLDRLEEAEAAFQLASERKVHVPEMLVQRYDLGFVRGNHAEMEQAAALELSKARDVEYGVALARAFSGDYSGSQTLVNDLAKRFPEDTSVRFSYLPVLRAVLALNREPARAIEMLQAAVPYELGVPI